MNYILQTNSLTKKYKNFQALNGLTMNVPKGSIYGFVGKNGAGKTTLIRLICGLQEPTSGSFSLYGIRNDSKDIIKSRRRMGAVVETPSIYMDMTAEENLKHQYLILGLSSFDCIHGIQHTSQSRSIGHFHADTLAANCVQFFCTQFLHHATIINDTVMSSQTGKFIQNVTGNKNCNLFFSVQLQNQFSHFHNTLRVETIYRLIKNKKVGITG